MTNLGKVRINKVSIKLVKESFGYYTKKNVRSPQDGADIFHEYLGTVDREHFVVACLNTKNEVVNITTAHIGSINASIVAPREVFKTAILSNSCSIMVCHNHPSGNTEPSREDIEVTRRLKECGELLGIELLDHIILGEDWDGDMTYVSLREKGYI